MALSRAYTEYLQEPDRTIKDITYNDDMSAMDLVVDRKAFGTSIADGLIVLPLMIVSGYYQTFGQ